MDCGRRRFKRRNAQIAREDKWSYLFPPSSPISSSYRTENNYHGMCGVIGSSKKTSEKVFYNGRFEDTKED